MSDYQEGITVTIKAHGGHDAPWFVIHAKDAASACDMVQAVEATGLPAIVGSVTQTIRAIDTLSQSFPGIRPAGHPDNGGAASPPATPPANTPPGSTAPICPHGTKVYKTGDKRDGSKWKAWMCPAPKGDESQCPPAWIK